MTLINRFNKTTREFEEAKADLVQAAEQMKLKIQELEMVRERDLELQKTNHNAKLEETRRGIALLEEEMAKQR
jgi:hypothetical protein